MKADLRQRLVNVAAIYSEVGENIAWVERARNLPARAIVLQQISPGRDYTHCGPDGLDRPRIQIDVWSDDWEHVQHLAAHVRNEIELTDANYRDVGTTRFWRGQVLGAFDSVPEDLEGGLKLFRETFDFQIPHSSII